MFCGHFEIKGNVVMNCDHVSCQLFTVISEYRELTYPSFFFMCSSNTFEQYSHCIRLMSRDLIPSFCLLFFPTAELWRLVAVRKVRRPEISRRSHGYFHLWLRVTVTVSHHALLSAWRVLAPGPSGHMRGDEIPLRTSSLPGAPAEGFDCK